MRQTGLSLLELFTLVVGILPLMPVAIALFRSIHIYRPISELVLLCMVWFCDGISRLLLSASGSPQPMLQLLFTSLENLIVLVLFASPMKPMAKEFAKWICALWVAGAACWIVSTGWRGPHFYLEGYLNLLPLLLIAYNLPEIVRTGGLSIFKKGFFWIAIAALFYLMTSMTILLTFWTDAQGLEASALPERIWMLQTAQFLRGIFFVFAVIMFQKPARASD